MTVIIPPMPPSPPQSLDYDEADEALASLTPDPAHVVPGNTENTVTEKGQTS